MEDLCKEVQSPTRKRTPGEQMADDACRWKKLFLFKTLSFFSCLISLSVCFPKMNDNLTSMNVKKSGQTKKRIQKLFKLYLILCHTSRDCSSYRALFGFGSRKRVPNCTAWHYCTVSFRQTWNAVLWQFFHRSVSVILMLKLTSVVSVWRQTQDLFVL